MKILSSALVATAFANSAAYAQLPARNCTEAITKCQIEGSTKPNIAERCRAAGEKCKKTGVFVGPITGRSWRFRNP